MILYTLAIMHGWLAQSIQGIALRQTQDFLPFVLVDFSHHRFFKLSFHQQRYLCRYRVGCLQARKHRWVSWTSGVRFYGDIFYLQTVFGPLNLGFNIFVRDKAAHTNIEWGKRFRGRKRPEELIQQRNKYGVQYKICSGVGLS